MKKKTTGSSRATVSTVPPAADCDVVLKLTNARVDSTRLYRYKIESVRTLIQPLATTLQGKKVGFDIGSYSVIENIVRNLEKPDYVDTMTIDDCCRLYNSFIKSLSNIVAMAKLDPRVEKAWLAVIRSAWITDDSIQEILGRKLNFIMRSYYMNGSIFTECAFNCLEPIYATSRYDSSAHEYVDSAIFTLNAADRMYLAQQFMGSDVLEPVVKESLPEDGGLTVGNFEANVAQETAFMNGLRVGGNPIGESGILTAAKIKSIKKGFAFGEFSHVAEGLASDRAELLLTAFFVWTNQTAKTDNVGTFARFLVNEYPKLIFGQQFNMFVPACRGFSRNLASAGSARSVIETVNELIRPSAEGWMSLSNLRLRYLCSGHGDNSGYGDDQICHLFNTYQREHLKIARRDGTKDCSSWSFDWFDEIDFPFIVNWLRLLWAAGIIEVAWSDDGSENGESLSGMCWIRMTELGLYAFMLAKRYEPKSSGLELSSLEFDERNSIFTIVGGNCPYEMFLRSVTDPISPTRFRITVMTLMRNCRAARDVENAIGSLKKIYDCSSSPRLTAIIDEARKRSDCVEKGTDAYALIKLRPDIPGLTGLLVADSEIRENVIFTESSYILVKRTFVDKFRSLCLRAGYILN